MPRHGTRERGTVPSSGAVAAYIPLGTTGHNPKSGWHHARRSGLRLTSPGTEASPPRLKVEIEVSDLNWRNTNRNLLIAAAVIVTIVVVVTLILGGGGSGGGSGGGY